MMRLILRTGLLAIVCSTAAAALPMPASATEWAQRHSDMPADPAVTFGDLPNGMRYAIMHNDMPKGALSMWLVVRTGSVQEQDAQQGLAHFLEHMAFRGSKHVPEKEVWPGLQRLGMGIGADANADTSFYATRYQFNFPHSDPQTVAEGLLRLRDIASDLTLSQESMDSERGAVLSEERLTDTPDLRAFKRQLDLWFPHGRVLSRIPIGMTDVIKHAPVSLIRDYYQSFYRPERTTLIVVGDVVPKSIETSVTKAFADWKPTGPAGADPAFLEAGKRMPQVSYFSEPGAPSALSMTWVTPNARDTKARERDDLIKLISLKILENRLKDFTSNGRHPVAQIQSGSTRDFRGSVLWSVNVAINPQDWRIVLDASEREARRLEKFGASNGEFARAKQDVLAQLQSSAASAAARPDRQLATELSDSVTQDEVFASPADMLALANDIFATLDVAEVNTAISKLVRDHGPLVFLTTPEPIQGGEAALQTAIASDEAEPLSRGTEGAHVSWPYTSFGTPGKVVEKAFITDLNVTFVRFANGVRLTVKPTAFKKGEIRVDVRVGHGRADLPAGQQTAAWAVGQNGFVYGGLKDISFQDMQSALAGKLYTTEAAIQDDGLMLWGRTRPSDLPTQLQVFAAYVSAPGWRPGALDQARTAELDMLRRTASSPTAMLGRDQACLLRSGDKRWCVPDLEELKAANTTSLQNLLTPILSSAPIEVTVAGDITSDAAIAAMAGTFGALPRRLSANGQTTQQTVAVQFPAGRSTPAELQHGGRADQGVAVVAWPTTDAFNLNKIETLRVLKSVMETRIMDELRIKDGATYSPYLDLAASKISPHFGYLLAATELPPDKMPLFFDVTQSIAKDLELRPISRDELERARKPLLEEMLARRQTNRYWASALVGTQEDPRRLEIIRQRASALNSVTEARVQDAAVTYLPYTKAWKLEIKAARGAQAPQKQ